MDHLSLTQEADRIVDLGRVDLPGARAALNALLDRTKRLDDSERNMALDFNARLVTELRLRGSRICDWGLTA